MNKRKRMYMNIAFKSNVQRAIEQEALTVYRKNAYDLEDLKARRQEVRELLEECDYDLPFSILQEAKVFLEFSLKVITQKIKNDLRMRVNQEIADKYYGGDPYGRKRVVA